MTASEILLIILAVPVILVAGVLLIPIIFSVADAVASVVFWIVVGLIVGVGKAYYWMEDKYDDWKRQMEYEKERKRDWDDAVQWSKDNPEAYQWAQKNPGAFRSKEDSCK